MLPRKLSRPRRGHQTSWKSRPADSFDFLEALDFPEHTPKELSSTSFSHLWDQFRDQLSSLDRQVFPHRGQDPAPVCRILKLGPYMDCASSGTFCAPAVGQCHRHLMTFPSSCCYFSQSTALKRTRDLSHQKPCWPVSLTRCLLPQCHVVSVTGQLKLILSQCQIILGYGSKPRTIIPSIAHCTDQTLRPTLLSMHQYIYTNTRYTTRILSEPTSPTGLLNRC